MTRTRAWLGALAALGLTLTGLGGPVLGAVPAATGAAATALVPDQCTAVAINVHKGRLEGAAGSRFLTVRVINEGSRACATPGWTRYRFVHAGRPIGFRSTRNPGYDPGKAPVLVKAGQTVRSTLSWVDPGPVSRAACHPRNATGARARIAGIPGAYTLHLKVPVCTTRKYRPHGTRVRH